MWVRKMHRAFIVTQVADCFGQVLEQITDRKIERERITRASLVKRVQMFRMCGLLSYSSAAV